MTNEVKPMKITNHEKGNKRTCIPPGRPSLMGYLFSFVFIIMAKNLCNMFESHQKRFK